MEAIPFGYFFSMALINYQMVIDPSLFPCIFVFH